MLLAAIDDPVKQVVLPLALAFIMFAMGLSLTGADFKRVASRPKAFIIGAMGQLVLLPLIAFAIASGFPMEGSIAVGIMVIAACPGGVTSNIMTHLAKGDSALSISLTAVISMVTVLTVPLLVNASLVHFTGASVDAQLNVGRTAVMLTLITIVPVALGMEIHRRWPNAAQALEPKARTLATVLFVLIVIGAILKDRANIPGWFAQAGIPVIALNLTSMAAAFALARGTRLSRREGIAITIECGLQNGTMAIVIAQTMLHNDAMMAPAAIYSLFMFVSGGAFIAIARRSVASAAADGAASA